MYFPNEIEIIMQGIEVIHKACHAKPHYNQRRQICALY